MMLADLVPPAGRWTMVRSGDVIPYADHRGKFRLGQALLAEVPDGSDLPVLSLTYASTATKAGRVVDAVFTDEDSGGNVTIGFGAPRHVLMVREAGRWRVGGELVAQDGRRVARGGDHRYTVVVDGTTLGDLGRRGPELYWAPAVGRGLIARERPGGVDPAELGRFGPEMRYAPKVGWGQLAKDIRSAPAALLRGSRGRTEPGWLAQTHAMRGTWDVWSELGSALVTVCPPGGAHYGRWALLPQMAEPAPPAAVLLAAYTVFATQ